MRSHQHQAEGKVTPLDLLHYEEWFTSFVVRGNCCLLFKLAFKITHGSFSVGLLFNQLVPSLNWCLGMFQLSAVLHMSLLNFMRLLTLSFPRSCWIEARVLGMPTAPHHLVLSANLQRVPSASCSGFSDSPSMRRKDTALVCGIYGLDIFWHLFLCLHTPTSLAKLV